MADPDYFTLTEFRALPKMGDDEKYTDDRVNAVAAGLTATIEREVGTSFVPRTYTETLTACDQDALVLEATDVQSITTITLNGTSVTPSDLYLHNGLVQYKSGVQWFGTFLRGNVVITYVAGRADVPADIKEALMWATRDELLATSETAGIDARRTSLITDQGTVNYILPGADHPTGFPKLDAAIMGWRDASGPSVA